MRLPSGYRIDYPQTVELRINIAWWREAIDYCRGAIRALRHKPKGRTSMLRGVLPANRVAAISTWLTALGAFVVGVTGTLPHAWQNYATLAVGLLTQGVTTIKFLAGAQQYDRLIAEGVFHRAATTDVPPPPVASVE